MRTWRPWKSLRSAYWRWRAMERRCLAARKKLERRYLDLRQVVESGSSSWNRTRDTWGRCQQPWNGTSSRRRLTARTSWPGPLPSWGRAFSGLCPWPCSRKCGRYAGHTEAVCREYEVMGARLRLAEKLIGLFRQDPSGAAPRDFRLALISPEAAWLAYQPREGCWLSVPGE